LLAEYLVTPVLLGLAFYVFFDYVGTGEAREVLHFLFLYCLQTTDLQYSLYIYHFSKHILSTVVVEILGFNTYSPTVTYNDTIVLGTLLAQNKRQSLSSRVYNLQITHKTEVNLFKQIYLFYCWRI